MFKSLMVCPKVSTQPFKSVFRSQLGGGGSSPLPKKNPKSFFQSKEYWGNFNIPLREGVENFLADMFSGHAFRGGGLDRPPSR